MKYRACVDVGGTFTDLVTSTEDGRIKVFKSSTTPDPTDGLFQAFKLAAESSGLTLEKWLSECTSLMYATTLVTNAVLQKRGAKIGLMCTEGFRDILSIREGGKDNALNFRMDYPDPYVPRYRTLPIRERINSEGGIEKCLVEEDVVDSLNKFKKWKVEAIAVSLLWSVMNPIHEKKIAEIIEREWPEIPYALSHESNPIIREYRRTSGTAINASMLPLVGSHTRYLERKLRNSGFLGELLMVNSVGGLMPPEEISKRPIYCIDSGPALAPVAGRMLGLKEKDVNSILTIDMGGTSFDTSLVKEGRITISSEGQVAGFALGIPKVDTRSIGAGGGSIAWVDKGGLLHVGPQSAGAFPGPACYMRGGSEATVTDANVVLGYLNPRYFLGGKMEIDPKRAEEVVQDRIAKPLNISIPEAALAVCTVVEQNMIAAIQDITLWQGIDPRDYLIVCGGGCSPLHIVPIARDLGVKRVLVPKIAGAFSAMGGICAEMLATFSAALFTESIRFDFEGVNKALERLEKQAGDFLTRSRTPPEDWTISFFAQARYPYQIWDLEVPLRKSRINDDFDVGQIVFDFHEVHERILAVKDTDQYVEITGWLVEAKGNPPTVYLEEIIEKKEEPSAAKFEKRIAYFKELGLVETPVYRGDRLQFGEIIHGPGIIEEATTTLVLSTGSTATVSKFGNYFVELG